MFIDDKTVHLFKSFKALPIKIKKITIYATKENRRIVISLKANPLSSISLPNPKSISDHHLLLSLSQIRQRRTLHRSNATPRPCQLRQLGLVPVDYAIYTAAGDKKSKADVDVLKDVLLPMQAEGQEYNEPQGLALFDCFEM